MYSIACVEILMWLVLLVYCSLHSSRSIFWGAGGGGGRGGWRAGRRFCIYMCSLENFSSAFNHETFLVKIVT